jgi:hypothetical protein
METTIGLAAGSDHPSIHDPSKSQSCFSCLKEADDAKPTGTNADNAEELNR